MIPPNPSSLYPREPPQPKILAALMQLIGLFYAGVERSIGRVVLDYGLPVCRVYDAYINAANDKW